MADKHILLARPRVGGSESQRSPGVWGLMPSDIGIEGTTHFDDFETFGVNATVWTLLEADGFADISQIEHLGGAVRMAVTTGANQEAYMQLGDGFGAAFLLGNAQGDLFYEARVAVDTINTGDGAFSVGLVPRGHVFANFLVDATGLIGNFLFLGFRTTGADGVNIDSVFKGGPPETVVEEAVHVLVPGEYVKLGMTIIRGIVTYFVNGIPREKTANTNALNFPLGLVMPHQAVKNLLDTDVNFDVDFVDIAQNREQ